MPSMECGRSVADVLSRTFCGCDECSVCLRDFPILSVQTPGCADYNEHLLFHGTSFDTARTICQEGFDFRAKDPVYYGKGTYFASQVRESAQDSQDTLPNTCMILSRVLVGNPEYAD